MSKTKIHNEWFDKLSKKTCQCGKKKTEVYSWGEYVNARWHTILHFCKDCFIDRVKTLLIQHASECGCAFNLVARSGSGPLPDWIKI